MINVKLFRVNRENLYSIASINRIIYNNIIKTFWKLNTERMIEMKTIMLKNDSKAYQFSFDKFEKISPIYSLGTTSFLIQSRTSNSVYSTSLFSHKETHLLHANVIDTFLFFLFGMCFSLNKSNFYLFLCLSLNSFCDETLRNRASLGPKARHHGFWLGSSPRRKKLKDGRKKEWEKRAKESPS